MLIKNDKMQFLADNISMVVNGFFPASYIVLIAKREWFV